jgi:CIC family chloride channel protein
MRFLSGRSTPGLTDVCVFAVGIGLVTGLGAIGFRLLIGLIHNLMFLGQWAWTYDANLHTPASPWGPLVILVPVLGGLVVTFLVVNFAPEARGHGVPEVMDSIYYREGRIRPMVAAVKSFASAFSIGSGASVGREGPIIQIGASLGSTFGQLLPVEAWQRITLVAAGAGAGIAATFNTPIGGVMFAVELLMPEVSARTFLPVALATGTATFIGRIFLGTQPAFHVPMPTDDGAPSIVLLCLFAVLGLLMGVAATAFVRGLHWAEITFGRIRSSYLRHIVGMLGMGVLIYALQRAFGHYFVAGVGYATIQDILAGQTDLPALLFLLWACKLLATSVSLGSGASGGIFSPSLFMGATLGGAFGALMARLAPGLPVSVPAFAMVGMAAMVGGASGAALTAVIMIFEMTRSYDIVMPMIVAVALSIGVRRLLSRENIYTIKLVGRRHFIPKAMHANMFLVRHASDIMERDVVVLPHDAPLDAFLRDQRGAALKHIVVRRGDRICGVLRINTGLRRGRSHAGLTLGEVAQSNYTIARADDTAFDVIKRLWRKNGAMAVVVEGPGRPRAGAVIGVITKEHIADSVADNVKSYAA